MIPATVPVLLAAQQASAPVSYDPNAQALFNAWAVDPGPARKAAYDNLIVGLKGLDLWNRLDCLYVLACHDREDALFNIRSPANHKLTKINSPDSGFTPDKGWTMPATAALLASGYIPDDPGGVLVQDSAILFGFVNYSNTGGGSTAAIIGPDNSGTDANASWLRAQNTNSAIEGKINAAGASISGNNSVTSRVGFVAASRTGATATSLYRNGAKVGGTSTQPSTGLGASSLQIGRLNTSNTTDRIAVAGWGASMSDPEVSALYGLLNDFLASYGAAAVPDYRGTLPAITPNTGIFEGMTLAADGAVAWNNATSYVYQWAADGVDIGGATAATYTLPNDAAGKTYTCRVAGVNANGQSIFATSAATSAVQEGAPVNTALPVVSGTPTWNQTLTASDGAWDPATPPVSFADQWLRNGSPIAGATAASYTLVDADIGAQISCRVTALSSTGLAAQATSLPTAAIASSAPINTDPPVVSGQPYLGQVLSSTTGTWISPASAGTVTYVYQWRRIVSGVTSNIPGATSSTYTLQAADVGNTVTCRITATNSTGSDLTQGLATPTIMGVPVIQTAPALSTTSPIVGASLGVTNGTWTNLPTSFAYQWRADGVAISGATSNSYTPVSGDVGKLLSCLVTATNPAGASAPAASNNSSAVAAGGGGFEPETTAYVAACTVAPSTTQQGYVDVLIKALKTAGVWSKLDVLHVYACHAEADAVINVKQPGSFNATRLSNAATGWSAAEGGYRFPASSALNTGFAPTDNPSAQFQWTNGHIGAYLRNSSNPTAGNTMPVMGIETASGNMTSLRLRDASANTAGWWGTPSILTFGAGPATRVGHAIMMRNGANVQAWDDAVQIGVDVAGGAASMLAGRTIWVGRFGTVFNTLEYFSFFHIGSALTVQQMTDMRTALRNYLTSMGITP